MQPQTACRVLLTCALVAGAATALHAQAAPAPSTAMTTRPSLIPWPTSVEMSASDAIAITKDTVIEVTPGQADLWRLATDLARLLRPALDATIAIRDIAGPAAAGSIRLEVVPATTALAGDGYDLTIGASGIRIAAATPAGIFYGTQTLRQLLPWAVELRGPRPFAVSVPAGHITDRPRYEWRGVFLDVSRHFFSVADVKRYIDLTAMYKMNRLHLHLSDDQGWRIDIASWPNLTRYGGSTAVGGGAGGFYTKADYAEIIAYARDRFMMVIPEIEMPSHCNAALAAYPELTCDGVAPPLYTGIEVGFSNFCFEKDITFKFLDDVIRELAAMTPGPYIHIAGDEVKKMTPEQYSRFMERAQGIVVRHGKTAIAWDEIIHGKMLPTTVVQYLAARRVAGAAARHEADPLAGQPPLPGHEVRRRHGARPELGRQRGRQRALRVGSGQAPERAGVVDPRCGDRDLVGDAGDDPRSRVPAVPAAARGGGTRVDRAVRPQLERLPRAPRRPGAALVGARDQRILVAEDRLDEVSSPLPRRSVAKPTRGDHSCRSAAIGSTLEARRAGRYAALSATQSSSPTASASVSGSCGATPNRRLSINRDAM